MLRACIIQSVVVRVVFIVVKNHLPINKLVFIFIYNTISIMYINVIRVKHENIGELN